METTSTVTPLAAKQKTPKGKALLPPSLTELDTAPDLQTLQFSVKRSNAPLSSQCSEVVSSAIQALAYRFAERGVTGVKIKMTEDAGKGAKMPQGVIEIAISPTPEHGVVTIKMGAFPGALWKGGPEMVSIREIDVYSVYDQPVNRTWSRRKDFSFNLDLLVSGILQYLPIRRAQVEAERAHRAELAITADQVVAFLSGQNIPYGRDGLDPVVITTDLAFEFQGIKGFTMKISEFGRVYVEGLGRVCEPDAVLAVRNLWMNLVSITIAPHSKDKES